jgi:hypothetical protein
MALSQIVELLAEKEAQIREIQRLLTEAQALLSLVLETDLQLEDSQPSRILPKTASSRLPANREIAG